jgi:hypothetical protein
MPNFIVRNNQYYKLEVSVEKNRAYLTILGFWKNAGVVPDYLDDWNKATSLLQKGFTVLTDASAMKTHPQDVRALHEQAQAIILKGGVSKVAEVLENDVTEMQLNAVARDTKIPKKNFRGVEDAELWLEA